jgi:predicted GNAT family acetyltransferase
VNLFGDPAKTLASFAAYGSFLIFVKPGHDILIMDEIQLSLNPKGHGAFFIEKDGERSAEMVVSVAGQNLTVYHTEVSEKLRGQGVAPRLLKAMTTYVREHGLKVIPLCPYVNAEFRRHPDQFADIWNQDWHGKP